MRFYRYLPFLVPIAGLVLLTGALRNPFASSTDEGPSLSAELSRLVDAGPDPRATSAVNRAIAVVSDPAHPWLQTDVHVRSLIPDLRFSAKGTFHRAPGQRFRMEIRTRMDEPGVSPNGEATVLAVSNGNDLWQATRTSKGDYRDVRRLRLAEIYNNTETLEHLDTVREKLITGPGIRGPEHMLRSLSHGVVWVYLDNSGGDQTVIGVWPRTTRDNLAPANDPWPAHLPRLCRLTLEGQGWPARLEWWGPTTDNGPDRLLVEIEFTHPIHDRVIPDHVCGQLFQFQPGTAAVTDTTTEIRAQVDPHP